MSKQDPAEQVRFLVSCIGHTTNGRPDFTLVAEELGIVSKAAAQKRYERMLKANGVNASKPAAKSSADDENTPSTPVKRKTTGVARGSAQKKSRAAKKEESDDEMKDTKPTPKGRAKAPKREPKKEPKKEPKEECDSSLSDAPDSGHSDAGTSFDSV
ncbi:hypothetical protein N5P37_000656 [Trichoderma harzianum]|nr:hypothetical protein N5P37_000656 [Trichoderma harzianum]